MVKNNLSRFFKFRSLLIAAFMSTNLIGCSILETTSADVSVEFPNDPRVDQSFVSGQPCNAPCWYGLELEKASLDDIRATLRSLPFINSESIREYKNSGSNDISFIADCVYSDSDEDCIWMETSPDGKLRQVILKIYYPLTLESAINQLGKPEYYISDPISGRDACSVHIYWPDAAVSAILEATPKEQYCTGEKSERISLGDQIELLVYTTIIAQQDGIPWMDNQ